MVTDLQLALACAAAYYSPPQSYDRFEEIGFTGEVESIETGTDAALIGKIDGHTVIAFRGTLATGAVGAIVQDWLQDLDDTLVVLEKGGVHQGFWKAVMRLDRFRDAERPLIFTGHSKGGAMALIAAHGTGAKVVTFASARAGDAEFAERYPENVTAYENADDIVPHLPPSAEIGWMLRLMGYRVKPRYRTVGAVKFIGWDGVTRGKSLLSRCLQVVSFARLLLTGDIKSIVEAHSIEGAYIPKLEGRGTGMKTPIWQGVTAAAVLVAFFTWFRPHADDVIRDHRTFLKRTGDVLEEQARTQAIGAKTLEHLERKADRSEEMLRDLHGHIIGRGQPEQVGPAVSGR